LGTRTEIGRIPLSPAALSISTRAFLLMSGKNGKTLASGKELSSVSLTSRIFVSQSVGFEAGEVYSDGAGLLSSS
jgi:hypothetical protein